MNGNAMVSVVVPVYNVQKYLNKCIDSLIEQTYTNMEIILIDDGSTDSSGEICDTYREKYTNIIVIHQKNKGLSGARNTGIVAAKGEYITFVDSDDFVSKDYIEYLYGLLIKYQADMAMCSNLKFFEDQRIVEEKNGEAVIKLFSTKESLSNMLYRKNITAYACGKMYSRKKLENIRFPEGQLFEDLNTTYKILDLCKKTCWSSAQKYFYLQRKDSIVNSRFDKRKMSVLDAGLEIKEFVQKKYPDIECAAKSKVFVSAVDLYRRLPKNKNLQDEKKYLKSLIKEYRGCVLRDSQNKMLTRIIALVACIDIDILCFMCKIYTKLTVTFHIQLNNPV